MMLQERFKMKDLGKLSYFLDIEFEHGDGFVKMSEKMYLSKISRQIIILLRIKTSTNISLQYECKLHCTLHCSLHCKLHCSFHCKLHCSLHCELHCSLHWSLHCKLHCSLHWSLQCKVICSLHCKLHCLLDSGAFPYIFCCRMQLNLARSTSVP